MEATWKVVGPKQPLSPAWLDALFQQLPEGVVVHEEGIIRACNPAAAIFGVSPEEMVGRPVFDFIAKSSQAAVKQQMSAPEPGSYVALGQHQDGSEVPVRVRPRTIETPEGAMRVVMMSAIDAEEADLDQLREALEQEDEVLRLKETSRFKTQILNTTAHELNTPLTPVRLQLHLLKTGALGQMSQRHTKAVGIIDRNIERLSFLVNDILDVARLESGRLEVHRAPVPVAAILEEAIESFEETARRVGVKLQLDAGPDMVLDADKDRITQIIFNLVGNALKFTPEGGRVRIGWRGDGDMARIEVKDTGPGLDADQIEQLFEPFSRVHDTKHSTIAGTGLGLYICKGLIDAHGGAIEALSDGPGKGATFAIHVPLSQENPMPAKKTARRKSLDPLAQRLRELI